VLIASPDAAVAPHQHDASWEVLATLTASGTAKRASAPGSADLAPTRIEGGAVVMMPKATTHAWEPDGKEPLVAIQLYVPPGPEQRFKALAGAAPAPR
jgi:mannose-6-phosphate isomerase-like protein (cupin superfamily)